MDRPSPERLAAQLKQIAKGNDPESTAFKFDSFREWREACSTEYLTGIEYRKRLEEKLKWKNL